MLDSLLLLSGNDIPFIEANLTIHNPTLKEIGYFVEDLTQEEISILAEDKNEFKRRFMEVNGLNNKLKLTLMK